MAGAIGGGAVMGRLLDALRWLWERLLWGGAADPGVADDDDENVPEWSGHYLSGGC